MAKALTPITIAALRAGAQRYEISDGGCAGLRVVVFPSKKKSFVVRYRFHGRPQKLTLGPCLIATGDSGVPELDTPLSLLSARMLAATALRQAKSGIDPAATKRSKKIALQRQFEAQRAAEADTFQVVAEDYLRQGSKLRSIRNRRADLQILYKPLGHLPVAAIKRSQYKRVLNSIAEHAPVRADRVLSAISGLLNWYADQSDDFVSPLARTKRYVKAKDIARDRVLSDDELRQLWTTATSHGGPYGAFLRFVLLTCTRRAEAGDIRRSELQGDDIWIIPGARYKTKLDTLIPLSRAARDITAAQPKLGDGDFVFTATGARGLTGFAEYKARFDKASGLTNWRLHDLRRTARTLLSRAGISADIAERCLGHVIGGVRGTYDRHGFEQEKRQAFEALAAQIDRIVNPQSKVTELAAARNKRRAKP
jgi:integrase